MEKLNQWLTLFANVGVLAGIVFLAVELQQNTQQLKLQSYQAWQTANNEINMTMADLDLAAVASAGHQDSTRLTRENYIAYAMFHLSMLQMAQTTHYLYLQGSLDEELWRAEMDRAAGVLSLRGVRQWWEAGGRTQVAPGFAEFIENFRVTKSRRWNWDENRGFYEDDFDAPYEETTE